MKVEKEKFINRSMIKRNRHKLFLFGDNVAQKGFGGQAKEMRGELNSLGIPTKKWPGLFVEHFFKDSEFENNKKHIDRAFSKINTSRFEIVVIPEDGIGTGLARLEENAPRTFKYLQDRLKELENGKN